MKPILATATLIGTNALDIDLNAYVSGVERRFVRLKVTRPCVADCRKDGFFPEP